ncbi:MAG: glycosyltransferase family 10 domain-containing protein [Chthoniobacterales bacterium]|jgi:hypothetical protein
MGSVPLKVGFVDIVPEVEPFVRRWLPRLVDYEVLTPERLEVERPDLLFYGDNRARRHRRFLDCTRVCVTFENLYPDFSEADYVMAYIHLEHPRYLRMPDWAIIHRPEQFIKDRGYADRILNEARDFCAFVASNGNPRRTRRRLEFFPRLSGYKKVNSGGRVMNNVGGCVEDHQAFARRHRFYMAFENAACPGYTTEKIADGMVNGCVPIYWGDPLVGQDFNPGSFINVGDFASDEEVIRHVARIDQDPDLYRGYLVEPFFHGNKPPDLFDEERVLGFFRRMLEDPRPRRKLFALRPGLFKMRRRMQPYLDSVFGTNSGAR